MPRSPAPTKGLRNGLKWRDGRPRWEPSPANRACGFVGMDLRDHAGAWMDRGAATTAADARTQWAKVVREAKADSDRGSKARAILRATLDKLPPMPVDPIPRRQRELVADLIEHARATMEERDADPANMTGRAPRTVAAMIEAYFNDPEAMRRISRGTQDAYRVQSRKLMARFGNVRVDEITLPMIRTWYLELQKEISTSTANLAIGTAGAMFQWAMWQDPQWITTSPCVGVAREQAKGRLVFWTPDEELSFVQWCDANGYEDVADAATICLWTGARQIDVCNATLDQLSGATWRFTPQKTQRKGQEALPGLLEPVHARITRRRAELQLDNLHPINPPVLWNRSMKRVHNTKSIHVRFKEAQSRALAAKAVPPSFAGKRLQDTRDTCVTRLAAANVSIDRIASWGGWSSESAKKILRNHYMSLLDESAMDDAAKLNQWASTQGLTITAA